MRYALSIIVILSLMGTAPALADDGHVSPNTLSALGLGGMEVVSDAEAMQVRGLSGNAWTQGLSIVMGILIDPNTKSYVWGTDVNYAHASAENAGLQVLTQAEHAQSSAIALDLEVTSVPGIYVGVLAGTAGGSGIAASQ
jgi:hypothetical protein